MSEKPKGGLKKGYVRMLFQTPKEVHVEFKIACIRHGFNMSEVLIDLMRTFINDVAEEHRVADAILESEDLSKYDVVPEDKSVMDYFNGDADE